MCGNFGLRGLLWALLERLVVRTLWALLEQLVTVYDFPNLTLRFATRCYLTVRRLPGKQMGGHQPPYYNDTMGGSG